MSTNPSRQISISKVVIDDEQIAAVTAVLRSGNIREGAECHAFEEEFAARIGARHALACNSGTAALQMAYGALLQPGDEVLVPAFTFYATASMVVAAGAVPVFCDIDPQTLNIDADDAESRITSRTRGIAPVHLFGNPADVDAVRALADRHHLAIIWDAAQAHDTLFNDKDIGTLPDTVCYSFYPSKNMTTGEGGMVCTNDDAVAERMKLLRSQGQSSRYVHVAQGYNFRMTDIQAAIGRGQLRHLTEWTAKRRANAAYLRQRFSETSLLRVQREQPLGTHVYHQFTILIDDHVDRDGVMTRIREAGVGCEIYYPIPLHRQPVFEKAAAGISLPGSEGASRTVLSIPVHPHLSEDDLHHVADSVLAALPSPV